MTNSSTSVKPSRRDNRLVLTTDNGRGRCSGKHACHDKAWRSRVACVGLSIATGTAAFSRDLFRSVLASQRIAQFLSKATNASADPLGVVAQGSMADGHVAFTLA